MINLLVVDDQPLFRSGVCKVLEAQPDMTIVGEAGNGVQAIGLAEQLRPDVILMDIQMPALDGVEATRAIMRRGLASQVILLTTFDDDDYVFDGLRAGAAGYLLKDTDVDQLLQAIRATARGESWLQPAIAAKLVAAWRAVDSRPRAANPLSQREQHILRLAAAGKTNREIGYALEHTEGTIKQYMSLIIEKLGARDRTHAVAIAKDQGFIGATDQGAPA